MKTVTRRIPPSALWLVAAVLLLNGASRYRFVRWDLTSSKRFTLSDSTLSMLRRLDDIVYVRCYLDGPLNADFKKLRQEIRELFDEMRAYAGDKFRYEFINPYAQGSGKDLKAVLKQLEEEGLQPTHVVDRAREKASETVVYPGAIFHYKGRRHPVNFLEAQLNRDPLSVLHQSIENLEYACSKAMYVLMAGDIRKHIYFTRGHGELSGYETVDAYTALSEMYSVQKAYVDERLAALPEDADLLVVAGPDSLFGDGARFNLDQFLMRGKPILWLLDKVEVNMDTMAAYGFTPALPKELNLEDMLFGYGVRVNTNLVRDARCDVIPVITGMYGGKPKTELMPWYFYPVVVPDERHMLTKGLASLRLKYASTVDTIAVPGIQKTVLLHSSELSQSAFAPFRVGLHFVRMPPDRDNFPKQNLPLAVLLEGRFTSAFKGRLVPKIPADSLPVQVLSESPENTRMIVCGTSSFISNVVDRRTGQPFPLGFEPGSRSYFPGNKQFILNCVNYLVGDAWLIPLRGKQFVIRLLDRPRVSEKSTQIQMLNTGLPLGFLAVLGSLFYFIHKRRYGYISKT
ncbi:MAG: gliding motility-associated ABC transporter substrate-binding protein GldG [Flavobacteriales bacterium]|nr:gliding motility-associated ABC transporter substrate-binding protein GldG [Flavobacteriales bacterium]MCX7650392.1 gliding motility-associated ABC transporter substrate-binding protein GldG [Flavobacteriales bacterium]MDW8433089.1 gliding motility-associated ABC transporter substrate-binding protein GldG [Flavobacteriales bacterium]